MADMRVLIPASACTVLRGGATDRRRARATGGIGIQASDDGHDRLRPVQGNPLDGPLSLIGKRWLSLLVQSGSSHDGCSGLYEIRSD